MNSTRSAHLRLTCRFVNQLGCLGFYKGPTFVAPLPPPVVLRLSCPDQKRSASHANRAAALSEDVSRIKATCGAAERSAAESRAAAEALEAELLIARERGEAASAAAEALRAERANLRDALAKVGGGGAAAVV